MQSKTMMKLLAALALLVVATPLTGCFGGTGQERVRIEYRDRVVETQKPCPAERPARPGPLARPLPSDAGRLVDLLTAKLEEWAGSGGYGDKADAAISRCTSEGS